MRDALAWFPEPRTAKPGPPSQENGLHPVGITCPCCHCSAQCVAVSAGPQVGVGKVTFTPGFRQVPWWASCPCTASNQVSMAAHHRRPGTETQARGSVSAAGDDCGGWWALHKRGVSSNPKSQIYGPLCEGKFKKKSYLQLFVRPRDLQPVGWLSDSFTENLQMVCHTCASYRGRGFFSRGPSLPGQFPAIGMA